MFLVDSLRGYCCKPLQRTSNQLVILKTPVSTIVPRHLFTKNPYISSKSTQRKILKSGAEGGA
jgi:hypothetical protein